MKNFNKILIPLTIISNENTYIFSYWEDLFEINDGPLAGYKNDVDEKGVNQVLLQILSYKDHLYSTKSYSYYPNYASLRKSYISHIQSLIEDLENDNSELESELETLNKKSPSSKTVEIFLKYGVLSEFYLFIPQEKNINEYEDLTNSDIYIKPQTESSYQKEKEEIICNENYKPKIESTFRYSDIKLATQVVIYSKAMFKAYDVTNFLSSVTTSVTINGGGNFSLKMNLVSTNELEQNVKNNNKKEYSYFQHHNYNVTGYQKALLLQSIFRSNDLVFIRFERLESEEDLDNKIIKGKYWDLIGLIDNTNISSDYINLNIDIQGRDLVKLFIEDSNYFIPYQFATSLSGVFGGNNSDIFKRLLDGNYHLEEVMALKSIENLMDFLVGHLTHIQVLSDACIDFLKEEYGSDLEKYVVPSQEEESKGIWGIIKVVVDETVQHYKLADTPLKNPDGSIMEQVSKICQKPFIEYIFDTFVDKYIINIRKPPITPTEISKQKFITIPRDYSISDNLSFSKEIYSVYQLNPQGGCLVSNSNFAVNYLPIVVLDEYTKLWGNKLYSQTYNYINIDNWNKLITEDQKSIKETFIEDLVWLIESTAYLPFSRTGTIVIKGDRRIKVGQWIYYEKSNEIFYVEGVSNSVSINNGSVERVTTLNVSRGLVKDYLIAKKSSFDEGVIQVSNVSYNDIIDIDFLKESLKNLTINISEAFKTQREIKEGEEFKPTDSIVIPEVFNFFLRGKQFEGEIYPYEYKYAEGGGASGLGNGRGRVGRRGLSFSVSLSGSEPQMPDELDREINNPPTPVINPNSDLKINTRRGTTTDGLTIFR